MDEIMDPEHRDELVERFTKIAEADVLTNAEGLAIVKILEEACRRESAELEERMLLEMIKGGPTPDAGE